MAGKLDQVLVLHTRVEVIHEARAHVGIGEVVPRRGREAGGCFGQLPHDAVLGDERHVADGGVGGERLAGARDGGDERRSVAARVVLAGRAIATAERADVEARANLREARQAEREKRVVDAELGRRVEEASGGGDRARCENHGHGDDGVAVAEVQLDPRIGHDPGIGKCSEVARNAGGSVEDRLVLPLGGIRARVDSGAQR